MSILDQVKELAENAVDATLGAGRVVVHAAETMTGFDLNNDGKVGDDAEADEEVEEIEEAEETEEAEEAVEIEETEEAEEAVEIEETEEATPVDSTKAVA